MQEALILLVEGQNNNHQILVNALQKANFHLHIVHTGEAALKAIEKIVPNLVVFDASGMRSNGARTCRRLRRSLRETPIIHARAAGQPEDRTAEADVYLEYPFTPRKLLNRIYALLPADDATEFVVRCGHIKLYLSKPSVELPGQGEHRLTPKLAQLLEEFVRHPNELISRRQLMQDVWKTDYIGDTRTLDVHIRWIREIIEENPARPQILRTVRGKGYVFCVPKPQEKAD